jgi:Rrf2 family protein
MHLTRASSYAIAALAHLVREKPDAPVASHDLARAEDIPEKFVLKILKTLVNARILRSVNGPHGGYSLAKAPKDVTLLDVVEAVEGPLRADAGTVGKEGAALDKRLQAVCDEALAVVRERLAKVTLAELARGK